MRRRPLRTVAEGSRIHCRSKNRRDKMIRGFLTGLLPLALTAGLFCQNSAPSASAGSAGPVKAYVSAHRQSIVDELEQFLAIPNLASDTANIQKNADALTAMLERRGFKTQLLRVENAPPAGLAWLPAGPNKRTVAFHAPSRGPPVENPHWAQDPWK